MKLNVRAITVLSVWRWQKKKKADAMHHLEGVWLVAYVFLDHILLLNKHKWIMNIFWPLTSQIYLNTLYLIQNDLFNSICLLRNKLFLGR